MGCYILLLVHEKKEKIDDCLPVAFLLFYRKSSSICFYFVRDWVRDERPSFDALKGGLLVAPILQTLILNRTPIQVLDFADTVSKWEIERIIPAHFINDLKYNGEDYRKAFSFLEDKGVPAGLPKPLEADLQFLRESEVGLIESGSIVVCPPLPGGKFTRDEILAKTILRS